MKKIFVFIIMLSILLIYIPVVYAESIDIDAESYLLLDSKTGQVLYEHNPNEKLFPASTTKILTAVLAIEKGNLTQIMTASKQAVNDIGKDGMNIGIIPDEELRLEDLLHALLITSANETANIIAENISPTRSEFVALMNKKALELGATSTNFVNPCGAHNPNHYTTAKDLSIISRYAMSLPKFREIVEEDSYNLPSTNKHTTWGKLPVTNKLLNTKSNYYTRIIGVKTGSTGEAGNNLVSSAVNSGGMELLAVVMGVRGPNAEKNIFAYSKELLEFGFRNYSSQIIVNADEIIKNVAVTDSKDNANLDLVTQSKFDYVLPIDKSSLNIQKVEHINTIITAPVKQGDVLGYIEIMRNGILLGKVNVIAAKSIDQNVKSIAMKAAKNTVKNPILNNLIIGVLILLTVFFLLRITLRRFSSKRKKAKNK